MATATKKFRAGKSQSRVPRSASDLVPLTWVTYRDDIGRHHWEILNGGGDILARSGSFSSQDDAERAARLVHRSAPSSRFESRAPGERQTAEA
jgi:uncharacterized protein YegP (UPF0339 family)